MTRFLLLVCAWLAVVNLSGCRDNAATNAQVDPSTLEGQPSTANPYGTPLPRIPATAPPTATVRPAATPFPLEVQGNASPVGPLLVRRGDEVWLVDLARPSRDERIPLGPKWGFVGSTPGALYFVEQLAMDDASRSTDARLVRVRGNEIAELWRFKPLYRGSLGGSIAITHDESMVAYVTNDGLRIRVMASGEDKLVAPNDYTGCSTRPIDIGRCATWTNARFSPDERSILAYRVEYEPAAAFLFDPSPTEQQGRRLPFLPWGDSWDGSTYCTSEGYDGFSWRVKATDLFRYDYRADRRVALSAPARATSVFGCRLGPSGELAVIWQLEDSKVLPDGTFIPDRWAVQIFDRNLEPGTAIDGTSDVIGWMPDGSGLVFQFPPSGYHAGPGEPRYLVLDRSGVWHTLPVNPGDRVIAMLPPSQ